MFASLIATTITLQSKFHEISKAIYSIRRTDEKSLKVGAYFFKNQNQLEI